MFQVFRRLGWHRCVAAELEALADYDKPIGIDGRPIGV